ncbi:MAG: 2-hydroxyacid dehydrogenase [Alphaproteobacteria bacterium]|nr:2-hydroxyacid dehydrogenase [Alphaproteobacteria bacterium]
MKVAFFDAKEYDVSSFNQVEDKGSLTFQFFETKLNENTVELAKGFDAICVFVNDTVNAAVIDKLVEYGCKVIALRCAGFNNVDVQHAYKKIHIVRVPAYSPYAVAEHAMAMILTSIRRIHKAFNRTRDFNFSLSGLVGFDLHGKTVGVVGTGKIGRIFIDICKGFGMNVLAYDKFPVPNSDIKYVELDELYAKSDIISLHCPLTPETKHLINKDTLKKMKDHVVLVNTSRGALINAVDLVEALKSRKVGVACLDVYEEEGDLFFRDYSNHILDDDVLARLLSMPNVLVTSHQAFLTNEALGNIAQTTTNNLKTYLAGNYITENEVCYQCGLADQCKKKRKERCF